VTINTSNASDDNYARIQLSGPACPFLAEGWCAIQKKLGEEYLSIMCSQYPRVMNLVDDVLQRSLDLSCPEAARVMLLDPGPMEFDEEDHPRSDPRLANLSVLSTADASAQKPYRHFREIRGFAIWLLQYRSYPLWKRLVILGSFCDQLQESSVSGGGSRTLEVLAGFRNAMARNLFDASFDSLAAQPAKQLELVLELIVARIGSDFTPPRFLSSYQEFMHGIDWRPESSMDDIGHRYAAAYSQYFAPFMLQHGHMLEHYLVSYVHRTLFPLGPQESSRGLSVGQLAQSVREQGMLLLIHYAVIQTVLIGLAGFHKSQFSVTHVLHLIQSFSKAFEHSVPFPERALKTLAEKNVKTCASLAILLLNDANA